MTGREVISEVVVRALDGAKEQPDMRAAGRALGTSARILAETVRTALLPLAVVNLGVRKFEDYLRGKFADELDAATAGIREGAIREPPLSIAGPVMQGLTFTHESEELRRMFLSLLATSMDASKEGQAHPAFADIIAQLDPREALYLSAVAAAEGAVDLVRIIEKTSPITSSIFYPHMAPLLVEGVPTTDERLPAFIENWVRLGLIEVDYTSQFANEVRYRWVDDWTFLNELVGGVGGTAEVERGRLQFTQWGAAFAEAIDLEAAPDNPYSFVAPPMRRGGAKSTEPNPVDIDGGTP